MSWRIRHQYGHGAANVELAAEPHFVAHRSLNLGSTLRDAGGDFYLTSLPPLLLAAFMVVALFVTVSQDKGYTDLEVVMIEREVQGWEEEIPEPEVIPEPEPPKLAEKKPEPPPPVKEPPKKKAKKKIAKPEPPPPVKQIAQARPKPKPRAKPKPKARPRPAPVKPDLPALAMQSAPKPPPPTARRGNRVRERAAKPKMAVAPIAQAPKLAPEREEKRSRRFAAVRSEAPRRKPKANLGPPIAARPLDAPAPEDLPARSSRRAAPRSASEKRQMARVSFAGAAAPEAAAPAPDARSRSRQRPVAQPGKRRAAPPPLEMAAAAPAAPDPRSIPSAPRRAERARTERNESTRKRSDHTASRGLAGVPLASLAACVSEQEEESLKRRLVAAVTTQRECVSRAGTYRFVETKNLNAFLMTIERAPGRPVADRCAELEYALRCVTR